MSKDFQWAPAQPTKEMVRAGMGVGDDNCLYWKHPQQAYVDMLAAAPKPPALGGEPEVLTLIEQGMWSCFGYGKDDYRGCTREQIEETREAVRAHLAPLQAEIERLGKEVSRKTHCYQVERAKLTEKNFEIDQLKAQCDEMEALLRDIRNSCELSRRRDAQIDATLSKPAENEQP